MNQPTNGNQLAEALRAKAARLRQGHYLTELQAQDLRDGADLLRVLANVVEGMSLAKAIGAPGDWGYETAIGQGVLALHRPPGVPPAYKPVTKEGRDA